MQKILVTGAMGMLSQDLCPILEDEGFDVVEVTFDNFDVTDFAATQEFITSANPDFVVHCAAYTNVDGAETDPETAHNVNLLGAENVAKACDKINATMIYISTDYVFDGEKKEPYLPDDKTNPLNVYGKTKLGGELAVQKFCKKHYIARTSWLYGHHGKNFVETMLSLADKPELKVVDDQHGCPTWTVDLSNAILDLIEENPPYGIYHLCGGGSTTWYGFAKEIFNQTGLSVNLLPCNTEDFPRPAKRPKHSVMDNAKCCRSWKIALKEYIELRDED